MTLITMILLVIFTEMVMLVVVEMASVKASVNNMQENMYVLCCAYKCVCAYVCVVYRHTKIDVQ